MSCPLLLSKKVDAALNWNWFRIPMMRSRCVLCTGTLLYCTVPYGTEQARTGGVRQNNFDYTCTSTLRGIGHVYNVFPLGFCRPPTTVRLLRGVRDKSKQAQTQHEPADRLEQSMLLVEHKQNGEHHEHQLA